MERSPIPEPDELTTPFWAGAGEGALTVQRCQACGHLRFPPSPICPRCLDPDATWVATSGRGEVLSYVVFHRAYNPAWAERVPYTVILVELDEGFRMFANVVDDAPVAVGERVRVRFAPLEGGFGLPEFEADR